MSDSERQNPVGWVRNVWRALPPNALVAAVLAALFITEDDLTGLLVLDP